jgi:hypothetical protein
MASAAGVSALALAQPAEGKIVYTLAHRVIAFGDIYKLDLNHDGITDFTLSQLLTGGHSFFYNNLSVRSNSIVVNASAGILALTSGVKVGSSRHFRDFAAHPGNMLHCQPGNNNAYCLHTGPTSSNWANVTNRYLGLKFLINGETHYGWARLTVKVKLQSNKVVITPLLTGYAYETVPNTPIITGQTRGADVVVARPASLGHLAQGASAISAWRVPAGR